MMTHIDYTSNFYKILSRLRIVEGRFASIDSAMFVAKLTYHLTRNQI